MTFACRSTLQGGGDGGCRCYTCASASRFLLFSSSIGTGRSAQAKFASSLAFPLFAPPCRVYHFTLFLVLLGRGCVAISFSSRVLVIDVDRAWGGFFDSRDTRLPMLRRGPYPLCNRVLLHRTHVASLSRFPYRSNNLHAIGEKRSTQGMAECDLLRRVHVAQQQARACVRQKMADGHWRLLPHTHCGHY